MSGKKKFLTTNKQALCWCKSRRAKITFEPDETSDKKIYCKVWLGRRCKIGDTLIKAVNSWVKHFNRD
jgi:hypothetical protein